MVSWLAPGSPPPGPSSPGPGSSSGSSPAPASARSSSASSSCGASNGCRRRRCGSASRAAARTSTAVTSSRPSHAACAIAARAVTRSARSPSTSNAAHTDGDLPQRGVGQRPPRAAGPGPRRSARPAPTRRRASARRTRRGRRRRPAAAGPPRRAGPASRGAAASTVSPNRSSSCGRSSPSSGFIVPTSRNRAACRTDTPVPLHVAGAQRGGVQQQVHQVVVQQVDLVHVQHAPVRGGQQPRLVRLDALGQRPLDVQGADQPVLGGADRQLDQPRGTGDRRRSGFVRAVRAGRVGRGRVAGEPAPGDDLARRAGSPPARAPWSTSRCPSRRAPAPRRCRATPR